MVDAAYRSDLRELNELNFARFEARLSERATASEAMFDRRVSEVEAGLNRRISEVEFRLDRRITEVEVGLDRRISEVESGLNQRIADLEGRMDAGFERLGITGGIDGIRAGQDRRDPGFGTLLVRIGRDLVGTFAGGKQQDGRGSG